MPTSLAVSRGRAAAAGPHRPERTGRPRLPAEAQGSRGGKEICWVSNDLLARCAVQVHGAHGLHLRPLELFVRAAMQFESAIQVSFGDKVADGKSILELASLGVPSGAVLEIVARGGDAQSAVAVLAPLIQRDYDSELAGEL